MTRHPLTSSARHLLATTVWRQTGDLLLARRILGHRSLRSMIGAPTVATNGDGHRPSLPTDRAAS